MKKIIVKHDNVSTDDPKSPVLMEWAAFYENGDPVKYTDGKPLANKALW